MEFVEVSAKDDMNVTQAFHKATINILDNVKSGAMKVDDRVILSVLKFRGLMEFLNLSLAIKNLG